MSSSTNATPLVSVLMPAYNVERYVEDAVASILAQTVSNIEVIAVDDGSSDGTLAILERMADQDSRLRIITMCKNTGLVAALNRGSTDCRAPYVARADADDISLPERIEKQLAFMEARPEIGLAGSAVRRINEIGEQVGAGFRVPTTERGIQRSIRWGLACLHPTWFVRRSVYEKLQGYRPVLAEDCDFLLRAATEGVVFGNVPDVLVEYRMRSSNYANLMGVRQYKSYCYVVKLYHQRLKDGADSFSLSDHERKTRVGPVEKAANWPRRWLINRAYTKPRALRRWCLLAMAAAVSPWYWVYYWRRIRRELAAMPGRS